ncbi:unnamed protein product, partial [Sphagnum compactum]
VIESSKKTNRKNVLIQELKREFKEVFQGNQGEPIREFKVNLDLKLEAQPKFIKAASVPYSLKEEVTRQLRELESR